MSNLLLPSYPTHTRAAARWRRGVTVLVALLLLHATSVPAAVDPAARIDRLSKLYEDGIAQGLRGDHEAAVIQFKNVLQKEPGHLPARIALGQANLMLGDAVAAEKELRLALAMGAATDQVFPLLGNALLAQRKFEEILQSIASRDPTYDGGFDIQLLRGRAFFELGRLDEARAAFSRAHELAAERPEPLIGLAQAALAVGQTAAALADIERAIAVAPDDTEAWFRKGEMLRHSGDDTAALAAFDQALETNPGALRVRLARAALHLQYGQLEAAFADASFVHSANPDDISAVFFVWQIHQQRGERHATKAALAELTGQLNRYTDDAIAKEPLLLRIAALVRYAKRDLVRTEQYLERYIKLRPNDTGMQRLHGQVQLLLGDAKSAIRSLYPLYQQNPANRDVLMTLGQAYLQTGHYSESESMLQQALALEPDSGTLNAHLALSRVGLGNFDAALAGLKEASTDEQRGRSAAMLLTVLQFKGGERRAALDTVRGLVEQHPQDARALNLLGVMQAAVGEMEASRMSFERAAESAPDFLPPVYNLARLDLAAGEMASAEGRLVAAVERNPRAESALLALADIALQRGDREAAAQWLDRAVSAAPEATMAQARLVELRLALNQPQEAFTAAQRLVDRNPENALAVETLARAQAALGKKPQAAKNYRDAVRYAGFDGTQLMRIAREQVALADFVEARRTLLKALNTSVATEARAALIRLDIRNGNYAAANKRIAEVVAAAPDDPEGDILTAELHARRSELDAAVAAYRAAQDKRPSTLAVLGLADALIADGRVEEAVGELEAWTTAHPDDREALRSLAMAYLPARRLAEAQALHEKLVVWEPGNATLLANLARLYQLASDGRARAVAERARAAAPTSAPVLDTLGWILVTEGETEQGLALLRDAISRQNNPLIRYHLAQALGELGRTDEAKLELKRIIKAGQPPELVREVQAYYDSLVAAP